MATLRGQLLVASPTLADPNFERTVVLIAEHSDEGAMGLVLNRPSETPVADAVPDLAELVIDDEPIRIGGPVQVQAVAVLAEFEDTGRAAALVFDDVGLVAAREDVEQLPGETRRACVFAGYAGWGPGQLEGELEREDWIIEPALREDLFDTEADELWSAVLARKGGPYALLARMPADPSMN